MNFKLVGIQGSNLLDGDKTYTLGQFSKFRGFSKNSNNNTVTYHNINELKTYLDFYA